ncbi:MAG: 1-acyl-sn-glycerol-3-phosphate acyltransferase [bacterium]|nr:1-acyl-sn-glycerol-3-phosphate acyltransferase [bacterium]
MCQEVDDTQKQKSPSGKVAKEQEQAVPERKPKLAKRVSNFFFRKRRSAAKASTDDAAGTKSHALNGSGRRYQRFVGAVHKVWGRTMDRLGFSVAFGAAAISSVLLFRVLNRTKVYGLNNIPTEHENVLYCINHNSLLDNFIFEAAAYVPKVLFQHKYLPISLADRRNFFGDPNSRKLQDRVMLILGRHFFRHLKAYPVDRRTGDMEQVEEWRRLLKDNIVIVYPEGTRSRTGKVGHGKPGVGKLIHEARPIVMPVFMSGTAQVLGVGMKCPKVFKTIKVYIGKPMELSALFKDELPEDRRGKMLYYIQISEAVMDRIRHLDPNYQEEDEQKTKEE